MSTSTPTKTDSVEVLAHQLGTHPCVLKGSAIDCRTKRAAVIFLYHGYIEAAADTNPGTFKVQVRPDAGDGSATEHWITVAEYVAVGSTPVVEDLTATEPIGETVMTVADEEPFASGDLVYLVDTTTLAASEWGEVLKVVVNTSIDLVDGLTTEKDSADKIWNDASKFVCALDLNAMESFRVIWCHGGAAGANGHVKALAITYDSDTIA